jgi:ferredoxin
VKAPDLDVRVDRAACRGARVCTRRAPRSFRLDAEGRAVASVPPGDEISPVLAAARACPNFAIEVRRGGARLA